MVFCNAEKPDEIMNSITTDAGGVRSLEFFRRDSNTKERLEWSVPRHVGLAGIQACIDRARRAMEGK